jgi:hypothetical protein
MAPKPIDISVVAIQNETKMRKKRLRTLLPLGADAHAPAY